MSLGTRRILPAAILAVTAFASQAGAQMLPKVSIGIDQAKSPQEAAVTLQLVFLMTILALAPSIVVLMTPFTRIVVVMGFLKRALGAQTVPPNQVIVGISLLLTWFVMQPQINQINETAYQPFMEQRIGHKEALDNAMKPMRAFMLRQCGENELAIMVKVSKTPRPATVDDIPNAVLIPSFAMSEMKTAFMIGFLIYLPFLVIDMVVASILMSLGMMMLPPVMVSLPLKLILFVLVDGWTLVTQGLVTSFR
ncbi:MAG: flagellar type III secretion system pore protein FliP [Fibrobacterota bacterium]|nr:flagellar type III secretion system pore protein FliP [Fibrobacterota bacterium]QQS03556.1 MAG: flagellar type III secretion system pore protein FliP [Fibrobacterota bacterium]